MKLHLFNKNHQQSRLAFIAEGEPVVLIENAVYMSSGLTDKLPKNCKLYVLEEDAIKRGIRETIDAGTILINRKEFVSLCVDHPATISW